MRAYEYASVKAVDHYINKIFPYLFITLSFTIPLVKGVPGIVHVLLISLFGIQMSYRWDFRTEGRKYYLAVLFFLGVSAISLINSYDPVDGFHLVKKQCLLLIGVILIERVSSTETARRCLYAYAAGGTGLACIGAYQGFFLNEYRPPHVNDYHPVWAGNLMMISFVVLLALIIGEKSYKLKILNVFMLMISGIALYFNGTRGVWVALLAVLFIAPFVQHGISVKKKLLYLLSLALIAIIACNTNHFHTRIGEAKADIEAYKSSISNTSLGERFEMWKASVSMFKQSPIIGIGIGSWKKELKAMIRRHKATPSIGIYGQTHNIYLDALSTRGLVGLVSLLLLLICPLYYAFKKREPEYVLYRNVVIFVAIAFMVSGLSETVVVLRLVFMSYILITGLGLAVLMSSSPKMIKGSAKINE
jgi:O-antigen ligase